jgi:hypothetical protein
MMNLFVWSDYLAERINGFLSGARNQGLRRMNNAGLVTEMALWAQRTVSHLILAGVFERHPTLRFVPRLKRRFRLWIAALPKSRS